MNKEKAIKALLTGAAFAGFIFLIGIFITLFAGSWTAIKNINQMHFIFGLEWMPYYEPPEYGILSMFISSALIGFCSSLICIPLGLGTAIYMYEIAGRKQKKFLKPALEILAGIPSIIFGFFAMAVLGPFLQNLFDLPSGLCILTASIALGIMTVPLISSISEDALSVVPISFKEASFALGANRCQTLIRVVIPAAASGIITSIILAFGRIVGETMIVLMASGGAIAVPNSPFAPARPLTSTIAAEMGEAAYGSLHFSALFEIGLFLFALTFILNFAAEKVGKKYRLKLGQGR
ncbi:MAG: phosphate ABC transporter permease subunit PstC [Elusimicrobiota bacterium]|jgi:phosphate transport system permease protein|nr:phosphate ABC transporter permease subunit PstC [Elusimicrobiota bacterium]